MSFIKNLLNNVDRVKYDEFKISENLVKNLEDSLENSIEMTENLVQEIAEENQKVFPFKNKNRKEGTMNVKLEGSNEIDLPKIPFGTFKGLTTKEAMTTTVTENKNLPSTLLEDERNDTYLKLREYEDCRRNLIAEHTVRKTSFGEVYEEKINRVFNEISTLEKNMEEYVRTTKERITFLTKQIDILNDEKKEKLYSIDKSFEMESARIDQLIKSYQTLLENLAIQIN